MLNQMMKAFEREFIGQSKEWHPVNDTVYYGRMTDADIEAMKQQRLTNWLAAVTPPETPPEAPQDTPPEA